MNINKNRAIDLISEDLQTIHHEIRTKAKEQGCEHELEDIKFQLLNYLNFLRKNP